MVEPPWRPWNKAGVVCQNWRSVVNVGGISNAMKAKKAKKVVQDGEVIAQLVTKKNFSPQQVTVALGYAAGSTNAYTRIIKGESSLGLCELSSLAALLEVAPFEIVKKDYQDEIPSVELEIYESEDEINEAVYGYEKSLGGRIAVLNSFPSMIYLPKTAARGKRYKLLMGREPKAERITNNEYYPLRAVLRFGFDALAPFSKEERITVLENIQKAFQKDGSIRLRQCIITDTEGFVYTPFAGNLEILGDKSYDMLVFTMPFYQYAILVVRSRQIATTVAKDVEMRAGAHVLKEDKTMKMLSIMRDCLKKDLSKHAFAEKLREEKSSFYQPVLDMLSAEGQEDAKGEG
jgi:hypothetical protein